jgi:hypothetical protein
VIADRVREDVAVIVQAADLLKLDARDRDAAARLTAAAGRLRVHAAALVRLAATATTGVTGAGQGANRPGDRIVERRFEIERSESGEINAGDADSMPRAPQRP